MQDKLNIHLIWGCDPNRQFESAWILSLFAGHYVKQSYWFEPDSDQPGIFGFDLTFVVETGLHTLFKKKLPEEFLHDFFSRRLARISHLSKLSYFSVIHLSDEDGSDGDQFYSLLPSACTVWRNFYHSRFAKLASVKVKSFPIGPRDIFLNHDTEYLLASQRKYPWAFMGTLWPSGSRKFAVSHFLRSFPTGYYYGGQSFANGIPLDEYKQNLLQSTFALAPEGDRHLDTFRLWESISCGCIPLVVDFNCQAKHLLPSNFPLPIFASWSEAVSYVNQLILCRSELDRIQLLMIKSWINYTADLKRELLL